MGVAAPGPVGVLGNGARFGAVRIHVNIAEDSGQIVLEDFGEDGGREARRRVVIVERAAEAGDAVAAGGDGANIVAHNDDGEPEFGAEARDELTESLLPRGVDADGRLVHEQDAWMSAERSGDHHALELASGERADVAVSERRRANPIEELVGKISRDTRAGSPGRRVQVYGHENGLVSAERERELGLYALGDVADDPFATGVGGGGAADRDGAGVGPEQAEQELQKR